MIQIKRNNKVFFTLEDFGEGSKLSYQLMDHHYIILKFTTATPVYFEIGDSVEIPDFGYFELTSSYFPKHNDSDGYDYEMQMDAYYMSWKNKICKYRPQHGANETSFNLTTTVGVHMNVILGNLKSLGLTYNGKDFSVDYTTYNNKAFDVQKRFLIEYGSISILDALNAICSEDALNCEWWIDGSIIYLGYCEMEGQTTFEQDVNVLSMSYSESKSTYITRLYAFGSDRNIPKGYFTGADADVTTDGVATDYLMLPNKEVDSDGFYAKDGYLENVNVVKNDKQAIEGVVMFEDEYPKVESAVSSIKTYDSTVDNEDGTKTTQTFWQVTSTDSFATNFEDSWIKSNLTLGIKFTSGALMGMEFDVSFKVIDNVNYFEIVANDTYGRTLPDGVMCPKVGDKFFIYNWDATKITDTDLIPTAQLSLFDRAKQYYQKTMISNSNFTCTMDGDKFYNNGTYDYHPLGEQVKLINDMFAQVDADGKHYRNSRIIGMEIPLDIPYDHPQYTVGEKAATSRLGKLEDKVDSITVNGTQIGGIGSGNGSGGVYVIGMNDLTPPTDSNVLSARKSINSFISKLTDDTAKGLITFAKGLIAKGLADLMMGAKFGNNAKITELGEAFFSVIKSLDYDNAAEQGFSVEKEKNGKYHAFFTNLTIWGKAIFHELEIRKLSYSGGNIYLSGAGSKLIKVVPVKQSVSADGVTTWVEMTEDDAESECVGWKCYLLADDGTTATMNYWQEGDQVRCQTMGEIVSGGTYQNASNKSYWRTIPNGGVSTQNEKIYGTKTETYLDEDGNEQTREVQVELYDGQAFAWIVIGKHSENFDGYTEDSAPDETKDIPAEGDTIVLDGNRHRDENTGKYDKTDRQNVIILETTGEYAPRIACYANITEYKHTITKRVNDSDKEVSLSVFETSPKGGTKINSSRFEWISDDGSTINIINYRGDWLSTNTYHKNDQVNHNNAVWVCIANSGVDVTEEPRDGVSNWKKVLSGGKGDKGDDAVSYGIQFSERITTISSVETKVLDVRFIKSVGQQITSGSINDIDFNGSCVVYIDGVMNGRMSNRLNSGQTYLDIYHAFADEIKGKKGLSVELLNSDAIVVASNTFSFVESGEGVVMAYKNAPSRPSKPTVEDLSQLSDGWSRAPQKGGSYEKVSNVSYGNYSVGATESGYSTSEWSEVSDGGYTWRKSPAGLSDNAGWALMKVSFTANVDNADVKVVIKAYSELGCDFIQVHDIDREITGSTSLRKNGVVYTSGNGVEDTYNFTSVGAGQHFFYVSYCKDLSLNANGDYGLFRLDLSENLASMPSTVWMSQAVLKEGKAVLPWSTPVQITGDDAYRVEVSPSTLVFDTNENGLVDTLSGKYATVTVYKGNQKISTDNLSLPSNYATKKCTNVDGSILNSDGDVRITIDSIGQETISGDVTVSKSSGQISFPIDVLGERSTLMWVTVNVQVNVSKFTGSVAFDNKGYKAQFDELSKNAATKNELKDVTSKFEQTAREISLSVSEKTIGRRNLLVGSAFNRQEGFGLNLDSNVRGYGILMNDGVDGMNCIKVASYYDGTRYQYCGAFWSGNYTKNIRIKHGTKYTFSCWVKVLDANTTVYLEVIYNRAEIGQDRDGSPTGTYYFAVEEPNKWQLVKWSFTTDDTHEWIEANVFTSSNVAYKTFVASFCKPMLAEGDYNGWTLSEQDYDYVGGNMLDNTLSLDKSGSLYDVNGTLTPAGFGESTSIYKSFVYKLKGTVDSFSQLPSSGNVYNDTYFVRNEVTCYAYNGSEFIKVTVNDSYYNILEWRKGKPGAFTPFGLEANKDYVFSFMAKGTGLLTAYFYNPETDVFIESSLGATNISVDGGTNFQLTNKWERYWVHWRPSDSLHKYVLLRLNRSFQSDGSAPITDCYIAQPKLEEGTRVTEYTERKSDLIDKASLKEAGILVDAESVTLYGNQVHIKKNKTDANDTVLIDNETGKVSAGLIDADKVVAEGIRAKNLEATNLNVTGNSKFGIWEIRKDEYFGEMIQARGDLQLPSGHTAQGSGVQYLPLYIRGGLANANYFRVGVSCTEFSYSYNGRDFCGVWTGKAADYVCGSVANTAFNTPTEYGYDESYHPAEYIYATKSSPNDPAFAINVQSSGTAGERTAIQTNAAIRGVLAPNAISINDTRTISNGIGVVICTNGSEMTLTLPANPLEGQTLIIIQGSTSRVYIVPSGNAKIYCGGYTRDKNNKFYSGAIGQFNIFVFVNNNWQLQWMNYKP